MMTLRAAFLCLAIALPLSTHAAAPVPACYADDFPSFLVAYADQVEVQRAHTRVPLESSAIVDADPEPKIVVKKLARQQIRFPVFLLKAQRQRTPLTMEIIALKGNSATVRLEKPDTDYVILYHFRKDPCWQLVRMENSSL